MMSDDEVRALVREIRAQLRGVDAVLDQMLNQLERQPAIDRTAALRELKRRGKVPSDQALFQLALKQGKLGSPSEHMHKLAKRLNKGKHSDEQQQGVRTFFRNQGR
jgi:Flp pilus assembly CpaE family ATPase